MDYQPLWICFDGKLTSLRCTFDRVYKLTLSCLANLLPQHVLRDVFWQTTDDDGTNCVRVCRCIGGIERRQRFDYLLFDSCSCTRAISWRGRRLITSAQKCA